MNRAVGSFTACALGSAAALLAAAYAFGGVAHLTAAVPAFLLTFLPALATLMWVVWAFRGAPQMILLAGLGGSGGRMFVALVGGLLLHLVDPEMFDIPFFCWLVVFYLVFLALEVAILVRSQKQIPLERVR